MSQKCWIKKQRRGTDYVTENKRMGGEMNETAISPAEKVLVSYEIEGGVDYG